jgi:hypothetical protein
MGDQFIEAINSAIDKVISGFQNNPSNYWNERDIHWNLFRYLKQQKVFQREHVTELIRAEFPTCRTYEGWRQARGHYDLVVLDPTSLANMSERVMSDWGPWREYLEQTQVLIAVEVKIWWYRWGDIGQRIEWDIKKLTDSRNKVRHPYYLNFIHIKSGQAEYYQKLRKHLEEQVKKYPKLKVLCVPSDPKINPQNGNWISAP